MLNKIIHFAAQAAETTEVQETTTLVETEFAGSTVPAGTTILFAAGLLLLAAAAIAVIAYLRNHVKNWAYPIYAGAIFYLLFSYIIIQLLSFGISFLPFVKAYAEAHNQVAPPYIQMIMYGLRIVTDAVAIYLGMKYFRSSAVKRRIEPVIGHAISFGVACYIAYVLVSGALTGYFQFISIAGTIKSQGYQTVLTQLITNNSTSFTQSYFETYLNSFIQPDVWRVLFATFVNREYWGSIPGIWPTLVMLAVYIAASVLVYGFQIKKLGVKWLIAAFALLAFLWIPYIPSVVLDLPAWATGIWYTALLGLAVLALLSVFRNELKDELKAFSYSRAEEQQKVYQQAHKMPKIVMPREEDRQPVGSAGVNTEEAEKEAEEAREAAEEAFGMTEKEAEALMAEEEADAAEEASDLPDEDGRKEES